MDTSTGAGSSKRQESDEGNSRPQIHARPKNRYVQIRDAAQGLETPVSSGGGAGVAATPELAPGHRSPPDTAARTQAEVRTATPTRRPATATAPRLLPSRTRGYDRPRRTEVPAPDREESERTHGHDRPRRMEVPQRAPSERDGLQRTARQRAQATTFRTQAPRSPARQQEMRTLRARLRRLEHLQQLEMRDDLGDDDFEEDDDVDYEVHDGDGDGAGRAPARRTQMRGRAPVGYQPKIPSFSGEAGDLVMVENFVSMVEGRLRVFGWDDDVVAMMVLDNLTGRARMAVEGAGGRARTSWVAMKAVLQRRFGIKRPAAHWWSKFGSLQQAGRETAAAFLTRVGLVINQLARHTDRPDMDQVRDAVFKGLRSPEIAMAVKVREWASLEDIQDFVDDLGLRDGNSAFVAAAEVEVPSKDEAATATAVAAAAVAKQQAPRSQKPPRPCPICGGDHWIRECSKRKGDSRRCFRCDRVGHIARNCTAPLRADKASDNKQTKDKGKEKKKKRRSRRRRSYSSSSQSSDGESRRSSRRGRSKRHGESSRDRRRRRHKRSVSASSSSSSGSDRSRSRSKEGSKGDRRKRRADAPHAAIACVAVTADDGNTEVTAPLVHVTVGGLPFVAMLDTGAEVSLVASRVVSLKDGPNLSRLQMATPVVVSGVWQESTRLTHGVQLAVSMNDVSMRHQFFVAPVATRLPHDVDFLCGFDFMKRHAVSVSLPVHGEPSVILHATGEHLPVLAKGATLFDAPVVCATMMDRLSAAASESDESGVAPSATRRRLPAAGVGVGVDAGLEAVARRTRSGGAFSDSDEEDSGWDTPEEGDVAGMLSGLEDAFCVDALDLGHVSEVQHHIETGEAAPTYTPAYRTSPPAQRIMTAHTQMWAIAGVIQPSQSPYCSPMVLVGKKDVSEDGVRRDAGMATRQRTPITAETRRKDRKRAKLVAKALKLAPGSARRAQLVARVLPELVAITKGTRCCVNYRELNAVTVNDAHPIVSAEASFDHCPPDVAMITTLDMKSAYMAVDIAPGDRAKTAFATPLGLMEFVRMPFGLKTAPMTMARVGTRLTDGLQYADVLVYYDDMAVITGTEQESPRLVWRRHCRAVRRVLRRCVKLGIKLGRAKCTFAVPAADWVDRNVSTDGFRKRGDQLTDVRDFPRPANSKALGRFLGLCGYYRGWIAGFAHIAAPLRSLCKPRTPFVWSDDCQTAFETLKTKVAEDVVLKVVDYGKAMVLETDASDVAVGAVLSQKDAQGKLRPVKILSKALDAAQKNYTVTERELLAIVWSVGRLRPLLLYLPFTVVTDHANLQWLLNRPRTGRIGRWVLALMEYSFTIVHKPGVKHVAPDALSRVQMPSTFEEMVRDARLMEIPESTLEQALQQHEGTKVTAPLVREDLPHVHELAETQRRDPLLVPVIDALMRDETVAVPYRPKWAYALEGGSGVLVVTKPEGGQCAVVPGELQAHYVAAAHDGHGHPGMKGTMDLLARRVFWLNMREDVEHHCRACVECVTRKTPAPKRHGLMTTFFVNEPFHTVHLDIVGPFVEAFDGCTHVLTMRDRFTRWAEVVPVRSTTASAIADAFLKGWVYRFGVPTHVITDQGSQFTGHVMAQLCKALGIKRRRTSAYHPQTNGAVERFHRDLSKALGSYVVDSEHRDWSDHVPMVAWARNTTPSRATGLSPFELLFGVPATTSFSVVAHRALPKSRTLEEYVKRMHDRWRGLYQAADEAQRRLGAANQKAYDEAHRTVEFAVGDWVLVHDLALGRGHGSPKFRPKFSKPAQIVAKVTPLLYDVRYQDRRSRRVVRIHVQRLQLYRPHPAVRAGRGAVAVGGSDAGAIAARSESSASEDGEDSDGNAEEEDSEVPGRDEEAKVDLKAYQVLKSDGHDNVLVFNEPGGFALWLHESGVPNAALTRYRSHARDRQWRKRVQKRLKHLNVLNEPGE